MNRFAFQELLTWKNSKIRKPLIIQGARQVGKTWLMKEFGKREFQNVVYLNFESSSRLRELFISDFNTCRFFSSMTVFSKQA